MLQPRMGPDESPFETKISFIFGHLFNSRKYIAYVALSEIFSFDCQIDLTDMNVIKATCPICKSTWCMLCQKKWNLHPSYCQFVGDLTAASSSAALMPWPSDNMMRR